MAFNTYTSAANRFSTQLHNNELSITFPYTAVSQEEEWLLDMFQFATTAPTPPPSVAGSALGASGFGYGRFGG